VRPLDELVARAEQKEPIPAGCIAVTFDDGYADNYEYARPILRAHGVKATFFVATGHVGTGRLLWFDEVLYAFARTRKRSVQFGWLTRAVPLGSEQQRVEAAFDALRILRSVGTIQLATALEELFTALGVERPGEDPRVMLNWAQVRELLQDGHRVGSHTVSHAILSQLQPREMEREIVESKRAIEDQTGQRVTTFAYPSGRPCDYGSGLGPMLRRAGYHAAVRNLAFSANTPDTDLFQLTRLRPWEEDVQSFRAKLCLYRLLECAPRSPGEDGRP
jgi:peptidoglycan/xylan/chitin deacetylase (PgdA/CDA1 family)